MVLDMQPGRYGKPGWMQNDRVVQDAAAVRPPEACRSKKMKIIPF